MSQQTTDQTTLTIGQDDNRERAKNFVELHDQVSASIELLDSLESFLGTFQNDLSAVSGQISDLQARSKEFEGRLQGRKRIERPLSQLLSDLSISPDLVTTILDTPVAEPWIAVIEEFQQKLQSVKVRSRVKAARDLAELVEGLRIAAATKIRAFFQAAMQPIRTSISTNMHVLQSSVFLKYAPLYAFLQRHAKTVAQEIQRAYIGCAKLYYETGFRRYTRSLGYIKTRTIEKSVLIGNVGNEPGIPGPFVDTERLVHAKLEGSGTTLAYMADDKNHKEPMESLFRSALMVLLDNACAEYLFIVKFFREPADIPAAPPSPMPRSPQPDRIGTDFGSERGGTTSKRMSIISVAESNQGVPTKEQEKEQRAMLDGIWKQIMEPATQFCKTFAESCLEPPPPIVPLLTMVRMNEVVLAESQKRDCAPLETFLLGLRLTMWPIFQKEMNAQVESLKKMVDGAGSGYLMRGTTLKDSSIQLVCQRYAALFTSFVALTGEDEEAMLFSNLMRLRQEVNRLIITQAGKMKDPAHSATYLATTYEILLHNLSVGPFIMVALQQAQVCLSRLDLILPLIPRLRQRLRTGDNEKKRLDRLNVVNALIFQYSSPKPAIND
ncbi:hypothetical protein FRB90_004305 [Tulasnella sp. 427]|nr:hypothetical protein FRB90_004305 [Tulasnella sp. 427]